MSDTLEKTVILMSQLPPAMQDAELIRLQAGADALAHIRKMQTEPKSTEKE